MDHPAPRTDRLPPLTAGPAPLAWPDPLGRAPGLYLAGSTEAPMWWMRRVGDGDSRSYVLSEQIDGVCDGLVVRFPASPEAPEHLRTTDFASIPFLLSSFIPGDGRATPPAILHDALIDSFLGQHYSWCGERDPIGSTPLSDATADRILRQHLNIAGVWPIRRWLIWAAVALRTLVNPDSSRRSSAKGPTAAADKSGVRLGRVLRTSPFFAVLLVGAVASWVAFLRLLGLHVFDDIGLGPLWKRVVVLFAVAGATAIAGSLVCALVGAARWRRHLVLGAIAGFGVVYLAVPATVSFAAWALYHPVDSLAAHEGFPWKVAQWRAQRGSNSNSSSTDE